MKPVYQTKFGGQNAPPEEWGNCMQAAIASALELPLDDVPDFVAEDDWWDKQCGFLKRFGLTLEAIDPSSISAPEGIHLTQGAGPREGTQHVVVGKDGELLHDPHPEGGGLVSVRAYWLFVCIDPARAVHQGETPS